MIFATGNMGKLREIKDILGDIGEEIISMKEAGIDVDIEENGTTFEENAIIKAKAIMEMTGQMVLADDSGLEVDALNKEPGIYSARYLGTDTPYEVKNQNIIDRLEGVEGDARSARFVCSMAFCAPDGVKLTIDGICEGHITSDIRGAEGFGYDPVFYCTKLCKTFGEASDEEKNTVSHRYNACKMLSPKLKEYIENK